jgi:hypothetical protein
MHWFSYLSENRPQNFQRIRDICTTNYAIELLEKLVETSDQTET